VTLAYRSSLLRGQRDDRFSRYQTAKKNGKLGEQTNLQGALALISNR